MRIIIHAGLEFQPAKHIQHFLGEKRGGLLKNGFLFPPDGGPLGHRPLFIAVLRNDHADPTRSEFGFADGERLEAFRAQAKTTFNSAILQNKPHTTIVSLPYAISRLARPEDVQALHSFFSEFSDDVQAVAFLPPPDEALVDNLIWQFTYGRTADLSAERALVKAPDYHEAALKGRSKGNHDDARFPVITDPAPFADYNGLAKLWGSVFGTNRFRMLPWHSANPDIHSVRDLCRDAFSLPGKIGRPSALKTHAASMTLETIQRLRAVNEILHEVESKQGVLPQRLRRRIALEAAVDGQPLKPGHLSSLVPKAAVPAGLNLAAPLDVPTLAPPVGFDAQRFVSNFASDIKTAAHLVRKRAAALELERKKRKSAERAARKLKLSDGGKRFLDAKAKVALRALVGSAYAPRHGKIVGFDEAQRLPDISSGARAQPTGTLVVGCMKNEGPYILEWVAFHLGIGVDTFLIYSNNCTDGTDQILTRLDDMGVVRHVSNDNWKGRSPQRAALSNAVTRPEYHQAKWIMHIDVDEFVNIRCGKKGTLDEVYEAMGDATNLAMTWRLFGHNGVTDFNDALVISQFTKCAPDWCPKPHTAWGFKTLLKNVGAYSRLACHRPKGLADGREDQVSWVNGSLRDMGLDIKARGWRSNQRTIGYDAVQLNHYALRSVDSFLIKRQRGRALHVDRTVGMNYWTRMDWNSQTDVSIQRHVPRTQAIMQQLLEDKLLGQLHQRSTEWHRQKAKELKTDPEFRNLFEQAVEMRLTDAERVAATLAADVES